MNSIIRKAVLPALATFFLCLSSCTPSSPSISSPDGRITIGFTLSETVPHYDVSYDGRPLIVSSALGLEAEGVNLSSGFSLKKVKRYSSDSWYDIPWGENKHIRDNHRGMVVSLRNVSGVELSLDFRAFDDGVAFRYSYVTPAKDSLKVMDEKTFFRFASDAVSWSIPGNFNTYELLYRTLPVSEVDNANTPFTLKSEDGVYMSVHEASLIDYPEMTLSSVGEKDFVSSLAPYPDGTKAIVGPSFSTPWRTIQIGEKAVDLVNSSLILNLNDPCVIDDTDFIRPVKYVGVWWGMHLGVNSWTQDSRHGATTEHAKEYIDFAARNGVDAVLFEGWNAGWETWGKGGVFDFTRPADDFDMEEVVSYAKSKGVSYILHHETGGNIPNYESQLDTAFAWARSLGIHAIKTGYAGGITGGYNHHGQYMVRHYRRVLRKAAEYGIMLDVHEPIKATGERRTYPNMMTREGARGMEWNAWSAGNPPEHQTILPFTRLLGGPMDYTPGIFDIQYRSIVGNKDLQAWNGPIATECRCNTTLAKQIADWVVLYSPMQMASDLISNYEGHPAFQFFRDYEADIDWSEALDGEIGDYIIVARRSGEKFFLGAVTDENSRTVDCLLSFLPSGRKYLATVYADGPEADWISDPYSYTIDKKVVSCSDTLKIVMAPGGGQAVSFIPAE
ncbi:MAG: glycoside hydrolase family 97 protein [Bacteroidales bacterium]|nr:glycoside hydrolase family 97 protein [Bacteroidales bacterium]